MSAVELSRTYQYTHCSLNGSEKEYTLLRIAATMTNIPSEKIPIRGIFFDNRNDRRKNIGRPMASMATSEVKLKTALVMR
jgi:hypothetical protein